MVGGWLFRRWLSRWSWLLIGLGLWLPARRWAKTPERARRRREMQYKLRETWRVRTTPPPPEEFIDS
ncbi:hypothetical protein TPY_1735 [Sulfobacillus acidophilus TPY]|uniref:Uncharacterized protein n=1 Tax=Sulfobacillus acidophilus (strain ATCC 700253 / DSM 10332 / NAL) TaxID=679936 RepID=G8U1A7_SULAD|nr:hypothetical protein TPY_1735 [Sulfobacillus acidophilus TPY]AEW05427.1 hypothetical protein Sulac_1935 [Sulfobacillus acidophilus DSM 10332]